MVLMNDLIYSADDVTKTNSVNTNAFSCPNYGVLGRMRDGEPYFFRRSLSRHTVNSEFNIKGLKDLPPVEIMYSYAFCSDVLIRSLIESGVDGIIIAGVGHGNYNRETAEMMKEALERGIVVVRSTRVFSGGVDTSAEEYDPKYPVAYMKNPQKARILLMLALSRYGKGDLQSNGNSTDSVTRIKEIQRIFAEY
jgi:L-asparaginase/Glu-tRNA(Gln) amidotransferase subunit D